MIDTTAVAKPSELIACLNIVIPAIAAIVTAIAGYFGGRVHEKRIVIKKNGGSK